MTDKVAAYIKGVKDGTIPSGVNLRNAIDRFEKDLTRKDIDYIPEKAEEVIRFISMLRHSTGIHNGKPFILEPWQEFIVCNLYGFYNKSGSRRFQTAYIEVARKQGKTQLAAAMALYGLIAEGEPAAEVLLAANSKEQAKRCFNAVTQMAHGFDSSGKYLKKYRYDVIFPSTNSFVKVLASDADNLDGYNCSLGIVDEFHSATDSSVRDVIRSGMGMRRNPLLITITTAGFDKSLPCYELRTVATEIAAGIKVDDSFFGLVYSLDDNDDWKDPQNWLKSNPNLGVTVNEDFLRTQVQQAINSPMDEVGIKTKNFNIWCDTATSWIPDEYIIAATKKLDRSSFEGCECYVGVDLASTTDLTAVSYLYVRDGYYYFMYDFYLPQDSLKGHVDSQMYQEWQRRGYLKTTPGNVTDYDYITKDIIDADKVTPIEAIYYDKYNATDWAIRCTDLGFNMQPFSQTIGNFNVPTRAFERLMLKGMVVLDDNPIIRYCLRSVELRMDFNGNVKPLKSQEKRKVDGVIASIQSIAAYNDVINKTAGTNIF